MHSECPCYDWASLPFKHGTTEMLLSRNVKRQVEAGKGRWATLSGAE